MKRKLCIMIALAAAVWVMAGSPHTAHAALLEPEGGGGGSTPPPSTCGSSLGSFSQAASKYQSFGDYNVAWINYYMYGNVAGYDKSVAGTIADKLQLDARAYSDVRIFGYQSRIAEIKAYAYSIYASSMGGAIDAYRMGTNVLHRSWNQNLTYSWSQSRKFLDKEKWFTVGWVPVKVTLTVTGSLGYDVYGGPETSGVSGTFNPWVNADATATAAVDIIVAAVGVEGYLRFIRIDAPVVGSLWLTSNCLNWSLNAQALLQSLDGRLRAFVQVLWETFYLTIFEWSGFSANYTLLNASGHVTLL